MAEEMVIGEIVGDNFRSCALRIKNIPDFLFLMHSFF